MLDSFRLYFRYIGISIRGQMQYRASFVMLSAGHFFVTGIEFLGIWAMFDRFGSLRGWSLAEVAMFYGMINVAFACADGFARGFDIFPQMVKSGDFDRLLLRPRSTALQVAAQELQLMRVGRLMQGLQELRGCFPRFSPHPRPLPACGEGREGGLDTETKPFWGQKLILTLSSPRAGRGENPFLCAQLRNSWTHHPAVGDERAACRVVSGESRADSFRHHRRGVHVLRVVRPASHAVVLDD